MRVVLVNERYGHTRTYVIRGWLKGLLSLCLLGAPVALGYLGYQLSVQSGEPLDPTYSQQTPAHAPPADAGLVAAGPADEAPFDLFMPGAEYAEPGAGWHETAAPFAPLVPLPATAAVTPAQQTFRHGRVVDPAAYLASVTH